MKCMSCFNQWCPANVYERLPGFSNQSLYSLSGRTSYRKISWSLEPGRSVLRPSLKGAMKFDMHIDSNAAEVPVRFQTDTIIITFNREMSALIEEMPRCVLGIQSLLLIIVYQWQEQYYLYQPISDGMNIYQDRNQFEMTYKCIWQL